MGIRKLEIFENFDRLCMELNRNGVFLLVDNPSSAPNPMTIGWATLGIIWHEPIMSVFVRPSRFTHGLIEKAKYFSVNVAHNKLKDELVFCGTESGRQFNKLKECKLETEPGINRNIPIIKSCNTFYECEIVHKNDLIKENLDEKIRQRYYPNDDYHTVYFGKVLDVYEK
jgi:flavin reductase (DIM6/NTAB) family NADH-FMN oxidoreductase RutF